MCLRIDKISLLVLKNLERQPKTKKENKIPNITGITKYHGLGSLQTTENYCSVLEVGFQDQGVRWLPLVDPSLIAAPFLYPQVKEGGRDLWSFYIRH